MFRFEDSWCLYEESKEVVAKAWNSVNNIDPGEKLFHGIKQSRLGLLDWKRTKLRNVQGVITNDSKRESVILAKEIDRLREPNDIYWQQWSRIELTKASSLMVRLLGMSFTKEEVKCGLFSMRKGKTPDPDGACDRGCLSSIRLGPACDPISHLLFANDTLLFGEATKSEACSIISILQQYEVLSGQLSSPQKSAVLFSPNVRKETREAISRILGMPEVTSHGSYLGLPWTISTSKQKVFSSIVGSVKSRIEDCKPKVLSKAGKAIFITSVSQSIHTYAMQCFKLSINTCHQINSNISNYWWGAMENKTNIHWVSYDTLCRDKADGGLGFRDTHAFNMALMRK
ncbi:hypothetical protein LIER_30289 [Lithospermum erythrorhizon]|uniref:Reverse transcriptase n=1 Tax=Lithospermum erythrorhizon TaxID=34254 RepID=A0AAV3RNZ9_LITER